VLRHGDLALDPRTRQVRRGDRAIALTRLEFEMLELFLRNQRFVLTRDVIFDRVWGYGFGTTSNTLNVQHRLPTAQALRVQQSEVMEIVEGQRPHDKPLPGDASIVRREPAHEEARGVTVFDTSEL
jgi:DNA-binding response OmpR family regulator